MSRIRIRGTLTAAKRLKGSARLRTRVTWASAKTEVDLDSLLAGGALASRRAGAALAGRPMAGVALVQTEEGVDLVRTKTEENLAKSKTKVTLVKMGVSLGRAVGEAALDGAGAEEGLARAQDGVDSARDSQIPSRDRTSLGRTLAKVARMSLTRTKTRRSLASAATWENLAPAVHGEAVASGMAEGISIRPTKAQSFGKLAWMTLDKTGVVASGRGLTGTAGAARAVAGVAEKAGAALVPLVEDRDHSSRKRRNRGVTVQGEGAGARTGVVPAGLLVRGVEAVEVLAQVALARTTHSPGKTSWTQTGASLTPASGTVTEETLASQDGAVAGAGAGAEEARTAPLGLIGSRDLLVRWTDSMGRMAKVAEAEEALARAAGVMMTWTR